MEASCCADVGVVREAEPLKLKKLVSSVMEAEWQIQMRYVQCVMVQKKKLLAPIATEQETLFAPIATEPKKSFVINVMAAGKNTDNNVALVWPTVGKQSALLCCKVFKNPL